MLRIVEVRGSEVQTLEGDEALARALPPAPDTVRWVDLSGQNAAVLQQLREQFDFHPLAIEDCRQFDQRPKLEEYRSHLFLVTQSFSSSSTNERLQAVELHELHAFLGDRYLVTVHSDALPALEEVRQRVKETPALLQRGPDFVYYLLASRLVEANFPVLDLITDELEELQDRVLHRPEPEDLTRIFSLKRQLVRMRKVLSPQRDTLAMLARRGDERVSERTSHYFRDVHDQLARLNESIETNRDLLSNALDAYLSAVSNRTNEVMKSLTLLSAVFLPLTFIVGFFGQNFQDLPGLPAWNASRALMNAAMLGCVATPGVMLLWFRSRRWL